MVQPRFPIYIPSYKRWQDGRHPTMDSLDEMNVSYTVVVRQEEYDDYVKVFGKEKVLAMSPKYLSEYKLLDDLGLSKSPGPGPQRNAAWDDAIKKGFKFHWVMDDNIQGFYRFHNNRQIKIVSGAFWRIMEDFVIKYKNIAMAGPNYKLFIPRKDKINPLIFNTRIYSCNLIRNDVPFRWRGRYNEDTILSLDMLKAGWATVQFNTLLQNKTPTQIIPGGNSEAFYFKEGTYPKSKMQKDVHPDVTTLKIKFHRWHHEVDYTPFKQIKLIPEEKKNIPEDAYKRYDFKIVPN